MGDKLLKMLSEIAIRIQLWKRICSIKGASNCFNNKMVKNELGVFDKQTPGTWGTDRSFGSICCMCRGDHTAGKYSDTAAKENIIFIF